MSYNKYCDMRYRNPNYQPKPKPKPASEKTLADLLREQIDNLIPLDQVPALTDPNPGPVKPVNPRVTAMTNLINRIK